MPIFDGSKLHPKSEEYQRRLKENFVTEEEAKTREGWRQGLSRVRKAMEAPFIVRSPLIQSIGQQVKEKRELCRLSGAQLQELSGVNRAEISKLENGRLNPTIEFLEKLANAMGYEVRVELVRKKRG